MPRARVALVLDHPQRDLTGLVLTAVELCQHDVECCLVPASLRAREIWGLAPDYVLLYNLRRGFDALVRQLGEARIAVGALDTEGGVWPQMRDYTELLLPDPALRRQVRPLCAWGPEVARHLVAEGLFAPEQLAVTGCPRFDLYHPAWRSVLATSADDDGVDDERPRILVNTNYSEANPRFGGAAEVRRHLERTFGWSPARVDELIATQSRALDETIALTRRLAEELPDVRVVLRPHPFEGTAVYVDRLGALPNLRLNLTGSVADQLRHAAVSIQRTSTTAIESAIAGVPSIVPMWVPAVGGMPVVEAVSERADTYEAVRAVIERVRTGRYAPDADTRRTIAAVVREGFHEQDGQAYRRVSEAVLAALPDRRRVDAACCRRFLHGFDVPRRGGDWAARRIRHGLRLSPDWSFRRLADAPSLEWTRTDQAYDAPATQAVADRVVHTRRAGGLAAVRDVRVRQARDCDAYLDRFHGHSVVLACDA